MNKRNQKLVSIVMSIFLATSLFVGIRPTNVQAQQASSSSIKEIAKQALMEQLEKNTTSTSKLDNKASKSSDEKAASEDTNKVVRVVVQLQEKASVDNASKSTESVKASQKAIIDKVKALTGATIRRSFGYLVNGFSLDVKKSDISKIQAISGVKSVTEANVYHPDMTFAKELTQAYGTWKDLGYKGEGMVVAIIDTGIDYHHKDMTITDTSKEKLTKDKVAKMSGKGTYFTDKVPYGYNFADDNQQVIDANPSEQHGMHVAGIVAANGKEDEVKNLTAIQGVAPEAQLLAMKVFSNTTGQMESAYDDDVIAAIEDSVAHGADVINMSLGSDCGFVDPSNPEQQAIQKATEQGTLCVISAGNAAISTTDSGWNDPETNWLGTTDTATVGDPGLAADSLCVASYENPRLITEQFSYTIGTDTGNMCYTKSEVDPSETLKTLKDYQLVDCGKGNNAIEGTGDDFTGKVNGKIALVNKVSGSYGNKKRAAQKAGAIGVIFYTVGDESLVSTSPLTGEITIPCINVASKDGLKLVNAVSTATVKFPGTYTSIPNASANGISPYSSYGPTPSLDFKPEITAPGGDIYSTQNNNKYVSMSGTSMAAPHTSGSEALILQGVKARLGLSGKELVSFAKKTAMNTAQVLMTREDTSVPYSPRVQGAGMIQIEDAIKNSVLATDDNGNASVALKEIGNTAKFNLNLKNYGTSDVTYTLQNGGIYSEKITDTDNMYFSDYQISGSTMNFNTKTVKVPAKSTASVTVTITIPDTFNKDKFVEGWVKFASNNAAAPSISVPYLGFYGSWSDENILDKPAWDSQTLVGAEALCSTYNGKVATLGIVGVDSKKHAIFDTNQIAFSPAVDSIHQNVFPRLSILRNAKSLDIDVVDKNDGTEKVLRKLTSDSNVKRTTIESVNGVKNYTGGFWDGSLYNQAKGNYQQAPDGQYYIRFTTKVDLPTAKPQVLYMPVKIDTSAPTISITSKGTSNGSSSYTVTWTAKDNNTSADLLAANSVVLLNGAKVDAKTSPVNYDKTTNTCSCTVTLQKGAPNDVVVGTVDMAGNMAIKDIPVDSPVLFDNLYEGQLVGSADLQKDGTFKVTGELDGTVSKLVVNGIQATVEDNYFEASILLNEGANTVKVEAYDNSGKEITTITKSYNVAQYKQVPQITLTSPVLDASKVFKTTDSIITLTGTVKLENPSLSSQVAVNGKVLSNTEYDQTTGAFNVKVPVNGFSPITIAATDQAGNMSQLQFITVATITNAPLQVIFDNLDSLESNLFITGNDVENDTLTITGSVNHMPKVFTINGTAVTINDDLTFSMDVKLVPGTNKFVIYAEDVDGTVVMNSSYKVLYDSVAPVVTLDSPKVQADGKIHTNQDSVELTGSAYDDTYGFTLNINDQYIISSDKYPTLGKDNMKKFDYTLPVKNGDIITITATDEFGNPSVEKIPVVVDKVGPSITISGVEEGKVYDNTVSPKVEIAATNNGIASQSVTLDGQKYNSGDAVTAIGQHKLVATATDNLGNVTTKTVNFSVQIKSEVNDPTTAETTMNTDLTKAIAVPGSTVAIDMTQIPEPAKNAVIPQSVLDTMKGHDVNLSVTAPTVNGISVTWTINGKDITGATKAINLALNSAVENQAAITKLAENSFALSLNSTNGVLPAKATLTIKAPWLEGKSKVFMYYYNPTTKSPELMKSTDNADGSFNVVNGTVTVSITHCSDYFFTTTALAAPGSSNNSGSIVKTGSMINFENLMGFGSLLTLLGVVLFIKKRN